MVGVAVVQLALAADGAGHVFEAVAGRMPLAVLALAPLGVAASCWLSRRCFPNSGGSGIPQVIAARHLHGLAARERLVSLRIAAGNSGPAGARIAVRRIHRREGPTVQVGVSIMFAIGRLSPRRQPGLLLAGASAGVATAFNTPLAGIVFGMEEMSRSFEARTSGIILGAVIAAGNISLSLQGDYTYLCTTGAVLGGTWQGLLAVPPLGVRTRKCAECPAQANELRTSRSLPGRW